MKRFILNYFPLKFIDEADEKSFRAKNYSLGSIRLVLVASSFTYISFLLVDYLVVREYFLYFLVIRFGFVFPILFIGYAATYNDFLSRRIDLIIITCCVIVSSSISLMQYTIRGTDVSGYYFFGLFQVLIFLYGFGRVPTLLALTCGMLIAVATTAIDVIFIEVKTSVSILKGALMLSLVATGFFISYIIELTSRRNYIYRKELENLSWTDALTGLNNRHFFNRFILQDLNRFIAQDEESITRIGSGDMITIVLFDIDDFKKINDTYGHEAGDLVLKQIGEKLIELSRKNDFIIRWGGEEFLVILNNIMDENIHATVKRIKDGITDYSFNIGSGKKIPLTISGGMITLSADDNSGTDNFVEVFNLVDQAMYSAKTAGKDCIYEAFFHKEEGEYRLRKTGENRLEDR